MDESKAMIRNPEDTENYEQVEESKEQVKSQVRTRGYSLLKKRVV